MTAPARLLLMAWFGTIASTALGLSYLAFAPVPASHAVDTLLAIGAGAVGAVGGGFVGGRVSAVVAAGRKKRLVSGSGEKGAPGGR